MDLLLIIAGLLDIAFGLEFLIKRRRILLGLVIGLIPTIILIGCWHEQSWPWWAGLILIPIGFLAGLIWHHDYKSPSKNS